MIRLSGVYFSFMATSQRPNRESPRPCRRKKIVEAVFALVADYAACHSLPNQAHGAPSG